MPKALGVAKATFYDWMREKRELKDAPARARVAHENLKAGLPYRNKDGPYLKPDSYTSEYDISVEGEHVIEAISTR